jgi:hypothetical protein
MRRVASAFLLLLSFGTLAEGQRLVFTMRTHPSCPLWITSSTQSKDYGFQTLTFASDSDKAIASVNLTVVLTYGEQEEPVDGNRVYVGLESGERKELDVFLGRMTALTQRAKELKQDVARAIVYVDSVDFADGTRWDPHQQLADNPSAPAK